MNGGKYFDVTEEEYQRLRDNVCERVYPDLPAEDIKPNEIGLTNFEYEIRLEDIERAVEEGNEKHGYGETLNAPVTVARKNAYAKGNRISKFIRLKEFFRYQPKRRTA